jgi:AcrR family transcriptional regulator
MTSPQVARVDGRRARGRRTRESILASAVHIASVDGLEGLTIGRLAGELGMSKSGLFAHFGSKEELQLATIDAARAIFVAEVVEPARAAGKGLPRLTTLLERWLAYMRREVFAGGCFFEAVRGEYDSRPRGPIRDLIGEQFTDWSNLLERLIRAAQDAGGLDPEVDPRLLAFELEAFGSAANVRYQLYGDRDAFTLAERAIRARLDAVTR